RPPIIREPVFRIRRPKPPAPRTTARAARCALLMMTATNNTPRLPFSIGGCWRRAKYAAGRDGSFEVTSARRKSAAAAGIPAAAKGHGGRGGSFAPSDVNPLGVRGGVRHRSSPDLALFAA
ncbi:MAG TPA: hypothetical protein VKP30_18980, partial [Polyangiaceae bacterium]|nr:hypothetical protein [Polyangiaceae bacterium]